MSVTQFWDEMYRDLSAEVIEAAKLLPAGARALDLGCGDGRNPLFLAAQGFKVTAVDISPVGVAKTQQFAAEQGLVINVLVQDMREFTFDTDYHLIVSMGCLHLIEREYWQPLLRQIQAHTCPGGYNAIGIMTDALPAPDDQRDFYIGLFKEGELFDYYVDWEILSQQSVQFHDEHPNGIRHHHAGDCILARKL